MRRVVWTGEAVTDLVGITAYVANFNRVAASKLRKRLVDAGNGLAVFPERAPLVAGNLRQLSSIYPYLIRYRVTDDNVTILRVRHGARLQD